MWKCLDTCKKIKSVFDDDALILLADICMIRSDSEQMTQVQGEHMLLIMHCWHYV